MTTPHNPAPPAVDKPLTTAQGHAIALRIVGKPERDVAQAVGVTRDTVRRWRHAQLGFIAALNSRGRALWHEAHERLRGLVGQAVDAIEQA